MSTIARRNNGVTLIRVTNIHKISSTEAEELISSFLGTIPDPQEAENPSYVSENDIEAESGNDTAAQSRMSSLSLSVVQQLNRMKRDFLGLPPLLRKRKAESYDPYSVSQDTAMIDAGAEVYRTEELVIGQQVATNGTDKEERKRMKKARREAEKKQKAAMTKA
ncbi:hypothetical protein V1512DRAFT_266553 [Lipomyces arxii]|uniref:uncharacterized protein n=1 Tax=Lipomyces arxii TaxID=56418 RepID=UPI0034CDDA6E